MAKILQGFDGQYADFGLDTDLNQKMWELGEHSWLSICSNGVHQKLADAASWVTFE